MAVHQCPRCPLRFSFRTELEFHLREDHAESTRASGRAGRQVGSAVVAPPGGRVADPVIAAAVSAPPISPLRFDAADRPQWPSHGVTLDSPVKEMPRDQDGNGLPLPKITLMPRGVVVAVIGIVIVLLGLGLVFGS